MKLHGVIPLDDDQLRMVPRAEALRGAAQALDGVQREAPPIQAAGVATLFAAFCVRTGSDPETLYQLGLKIMRPEPFGNKTNQLAESTRDYIGLCVMGEEVVVA